MLNREITIAVQITKPGREDLNSNLALTRYLWLTFLVLRGLVMEAGYSKKTALTFFFPTEPKKVAGKYRKWLTVLQI